MNTLEFYVMCYDCGEELRVDIEGSKIAVFPCATCGDERYMDGWKKATESLK